MLIVPVLPKEHTVFRFEIPMAATSAPSGENAEEPKSLTFELYGSQFENRAPDRANKKFKPHKMPDL